LPCNILEAKSYTIPTGKKSLAARPQAATSASLLGLHCCMTTISGRKLQAAAQCSLEQKLYQKKTTLNLLSTCTPAFQHGKPCITAPEAAAVLLACSKAAFQTILAILE